MSQSCSVEKVKHLANEKIKEMLFFFNVCRFLKLICGGRAWKDPTSRLLVLSSSVSWENEMKHEWRILSGKALILQGFLVSETVHCICRPWQIIQLIFLSPWIVAYICTHVKVIDLIILIGQFKMIKSIVSVKRQQNSFHSTVREAY